MAGPLAGVRVLELAGIGPAPFAGAMLADMGADVVRLERIPMHRVAPEMPPQFDFYNRNKRSLAMDLKRPQAVAAAMRMVTQADILLEGFRPGVTERLGLSPATCLAANPRLVYGRMTGWGQDGPMAQTVGHDINYLALTGALYSMGTQDRPPPPPLNLVADLGGGAMFLIMGVLAAHIESSKSGQGQVVDAAMLDGIANLMSAFQAFRQLGQWHGRNENTVDGGAPFYRTYETSDHKYISVGALEPHFYAELLRAMDLQNADLPPQYDRASWPAVREWFASVFRGRTREQWVQAMAGYDACFAPVLDIDEAPQHPQMQARGSFTRFDGVLHPTPAPRFASTPGALRRPAPAAGEHSLEVLREWGVPADDITALHEAGAVFQGER